MGLILEEKNTNTHVTITTMQQTKTETWKKICITKLCGN